MKVYRFTGNRKKEYNAVVSLKIVYHSLHEMELFIFCHIEGNTPISMHE